MRVAEEPERADVAAVHFPDPSEPLKAYELAVLHDSMDAVVSRVSLDKEKLRIEFGKGTSISVDTSFRSGLSFELRAEGFLLSVGFGMVQNSPSFPEVDR